MLQPTPQETLRQLCALFPTFSEWWENEEAPPAEDGLVDGIYYEWTHHRILQEFLIYFGMNHHLFDEKHLRTLGSWLNAAVSGGGVLENAVSTCFLEHTHQVEVYA